MKKLILFICFLAALGLLYSPIAEAKGFSSGGRSGGFSSGGKSGGVSKSGGGSKVSGSKSGSQAKPAAAPKPVTKSYKGSKYSIPNKIATSKKVPSSYRDRDGYAYHHSSFSNFWMWAFIFHGSYDDEDYEDCDTEDLNTGDADCQYAYEYGGEPNNNLLGWFVAIVGSVIGIAVAGVLFLWFMSWRESRLY